LRSTAGQQQVSRLREKVKTPTASSQTSRKETIFCGFVLAPATSHRQVRQGLRQGYMVKSGGLKAKSQLFVPPAASICRSCLFLGHSKESHKGQEVK